MDSSSLPRDAGDQIKLIGKRIRNLRRQQGLSLQDLATTSGLSVSFLSLVERGHSTLALTSLFSVATALGVDVEDLLPKSRTGLIPSGHLEVTRDYGADLVPITIGDREYRFLSARVEGRVLEPLLVTVQPTMHAEFPYGHKGEEFAWVIRGELVYIVDGREYLLRPGDSIHMISSVPHALRNDTAEVAVALWVLSQPIVHESLGELTIGHEEIE